MRRLMQFRLAIVLFALVLIPPATLPFAESIRTEWIRFWEPEEEETEVVVESLDFDIPIQLNLPPLIFIESQQMQMDGRLTVPVEPDIDVPDA